MAVITTKGLTKYFYTPFTLKRIPALTDLTLQIDPGEVFGYVGPNGAGKTTTFKLLLDFIRPSRGTCLLWGANPGCIEVKSRVGFLPESPYFYAYLKVKEYLCFCGHLFGLSRKELGRAVDALLDQVGLSGHRDKLIKHLSKGLLQRLGLAQAMINDPELLILDEPMSGLDPLGRKEVRDTILHLKERGKTIIFSTHILSDVETVCDRVGILLNGRLKDCGPLARLLTPKIRSVEVCVRDLPAETIRILKERGLPLQQKGSEILVRVSEKEAAGLLAALVDKGGILVSFVPQRETLEDIYVSEIQSLNKALPQ